MKRPLNVVILGATGSIGAQAIDVLARYPDRFRAFGLVSGRRRPELDAPHVLTGADPDLEARIDELVADPAVDVVLVAIPGARALRPTLTALRAKKVVAIASKEVLVMAGELVMALGHHGALRPVDSEHSAIWQCLWGESPGAVSRLVLTATGGPFWARPGLDLASVTPEQALAHPRWRMGPKVSIDSATLMNKGLELVEAHHLFGVGLDRIAVLVHPGAVAHSLVEFVDGSTKAQLGTADMRLPIGLALAYPDRLPGLVPPAVLAGEPLEFHELDAARFPAVELCRRAAERGGGAPAVLNAANEVAVAAFLEGALRFDEIVPAVAAAVESWPGEATDLEGILAADAWSREYVRARLGSYSR